MSSVNKLLVGSLFIAFAFGSIDSADAHLKFRKRMQEKYAGMKVDCNACHVAKKPKTERSDFGKLFGKKLKKSHPTLTADYKSKKGADKKAFEKDVLIPAFDEVLKKVKAEKNKAGEVYDDLIKAGKVPMIVKDPKYKPPKDGEKSGK